MSADPSSDETCIVCGKSTEGAAGFAHLYHEGRRFALCCPMCVQMFERHRDRFTRGDRPQSLLDELTQEITWKNDPH
jgi:hypothetical protein